jgi:hypothetical protein
MFTNAHIIHTSSFQNGIVSYPDQFGYRRMVRRQNDYLVRLYWHFKEYLDKDRMVYFDTLTYDDAHLPYVSDFADFEENFSCFNPQDCKQFLDRLHSRLSYYGYGSFTHFICSEYGHDRVYLDHRGRFRKGTKRPHYHILLFLDQKLDPVWLAQVVHDCWKCGRTDNFGSYVGERSRSYVVHNTFTKASLSLDRMLRVTHYVSKYVLKDSKFSRRVDRICKYYVRKSYGNINDICKKKSYQHDVNELRRKIGEFIMISNGFGSYFLEPNNLDLNLIYERSSVCIPDKDKIKRYYPLPEYYLRKLFFKLSHRSWHLNDAGKKYYRYHLANKSRDYARFLENVSLNLDDGLRSRLLFLMDGRSFSQLADYCIYYKGRICDPSCLDSLPSKDDVVNRLICIDADETPTLMNDPIPEIEYKVALEPRTFWIIDDVSHFSYMSITEVLKRSIRIDDWKQYIIDDSWFPDHYDFDECLRILMEYVGSVEISRQELYDKKSYLNQQLSLFGLSPKV